MAKLISMFLILMAMQVCIIMYADKTPDSTLIWNFITNMAEWNTLGFVLAIVGLAAGIGLIGVTAGAIFGFKTDFLIFAPAIAGFLYMGVVFIDLAAVLRDELIARVFTTCPADATIVTCPPVALIVAVTIGLVAFYYVWTVVSWWRGIDY